MKLHILAFGISGDILGSQKIVFNLKSSSNTVKQLRGALVDTYPKIGELKNYLIAVNTEYADDNIVLHNDDEVAIIPPTSGG